MQKNEFYKHRRRFMLVHIMTCIVTQRFDSATYLYELGLLYSYLNDALEYVWLILTALNRARYWRLICSLMGVMQKSINFFRC